MDLKAREIPKPVTDTRTLACDHEEIIQKAYWGYGCKNYNKEYYRDKYGYR